MGGDAREQPAEDVVLLDDADVEGPLPSQVVEFTAWDHDGWSAVMVALIRRFHRVTTRPPSGPSGSSGEMPADMRYWQAVREIWGVQAEGLDAVAEPFEHRPVPQPIAVGQQGGRAV